MEAEKARGTIHAVSERFGVSPSLVGRHPSAVLANRQREGSADGWAPAFGFEEGYEPRILALLEGQTDLTQDETSAAAGPAGTARAGYQSGLAVLSPTQDPRQRSPRTRPNRHLLTWRHNVGAGGKNGVGSRLSG